MHSQSPLALLGSTALLLMQEFFFRTKFYKKIGLCFFLIVICVASISTPVIANGVAITVNGESIRVAELDLVQGEILGRQVVDYGVPRTRKEAAETLIYELLLAQAAVKAGLDRDLQFQFDVKRARRQILIDAYLADFLQEIAYPDEKTIERYIADHPNHFSGRRIFHYLRITWPAANEISERRLKEALRTHRDLSSIEMWLRRNGLNIRIESRWQGVEQIEQLHVAALETMSDGELRLVSELDGLQLVILQRKQAIRDPVDPKKVGSAIAQGLRQDARAAALKNKLATLRQQASIVIAAPDDPMSDPVARISGSPISQMDLACVLKEQGISDPTPRIRSHVLNRLIEEWLLEQQANDHKISANPEVALALERASRRILATRYLEQETRKIAQPEMYSINQYIRLNPHLFSERKVLQFQEIVLKPIDRDTLGEVKRVVAENNNPGKLEQWLRSKDLAVSQNFLFRGPEELDKTYLDALEKMADGEMVLVSVMHDQRHAVIRRIGEYSDPIDLEQARLSVARILHSNASGEAIRSVIGRLHSAASIVVNDPLLSLDKSRGPTTARASDASRWGKKQSLAFVVILINVSAVLLVPGVLLWLVYQTRRRMDFVLGFERNLAWSERLAEITHSRYFLAISGGFIAMIVISIGLMTAIPLRSFQSAGRTLIAAVLGVVLSILGYSALYLLKEDGPTKSVWMNRWGPTVFLLSMQALLLVIVMTEKI